MATISGGVSSNSTTYTPGSTLGGNLSLQGLANLFPAETAGTTYNVPIQQNTANQLVFPTAAAKSDPFASTGLTQAPLIAQAPLSVQNPFAGQSQADGTAPLLEAQSQAATPSPELKIDRAGPMARAAQTMQDAMSPTPTSAGSASGGAPSQGESVDSVDSRLQRMEKNLEQFQEAFYGAPPQQPQAAPQAQAGGPIIMQPQTGYQPAPVAPTQQPGTYMPYSNMNQNMPWWKRAAMNYNMARHPHIANYLQAQMMNERALEVARINANAQYQREQMQQDRLDSRQSAELGAKADEGRLDRQSKENIARIGQGLTLAQKYTQVGEFIKLPPGSEGRKQMAAINPDLQAHINDPQDEKAAAEYASAGLKMQKDIIENTVASATLGSNIQKIMADAKKAGIDAEKEFAMLSADIRKRTADAEKAVVGARVAQATEGADINLANQKAYGAYVDNAFAPTLKGQAMLGNQVNMGLKQMLGVQSLTAPGVSVQNGTPEQREAARQALQNFNNYKSNLSREGMRNLMTGGMTVPPPPNVGPAMSAGYQPAQLPPPPIMPRGGMAAPGMLPPPPAMIPMSLPQWMPNPYNQPGGIVPPPPPLPGMPQQVPPQMAPQPQGAPPRQGMLEVQSPGVPMAAAPLQQPGAPNLQPAPQGQAPQVPQQALNIPRQNPLDENLRRAQLVATQLPGSIAKSVIGAAPAKLAGIPGQIYNALKGAADAGDKAIGEARQRAFENEMKNSITEFMRPGSRALPSGTPLTDPELISQFAIKSHGNQRWFNQMVNAAGWGPISATRQPQPMSQAMQDRYNFDRFGAQMTADPEAYRRYRAQQDMNEWKRAEEEAKRKATLGSLGNYRIQAQSSQESN